ncbi:MAG: serine/threonine protein kinase [Planctomycetes bacterium]|nr:serine/threonine protein kinase [Planctomycetota bacterium]
MDTERFAALRRVFDAALDHAADARAGFVRASCGGDAALAEEVLALLDADTKASATVALVDAPGQVLAAVHDLVGQDLAGFRILRRIGSGGMGTVYEARQERPSRLVAFKTLAVSLTSERARRRLEDEAEILARLRHPGIAQVLEAGTFQLGADRVPWFAMELVEDPRPIDRHVREAGSDARAIARLLVAVCAAVHSAHQRGVIHRDLKPANILVDRHGQPKVIDFGIARVVGAATARTTRTGEILGTLAYMSPERLEQGQGEDTASDVYALGVVLYELLAGRPPFPIDGLPPARAIDVLRASEPVPPSRAGGPVAVPRELDWITLRAIARLPAERYASVAELAQDLERFLGDEPVAAGPPSATYRLRKLARRHRLALGAAAAVFLAVVAGAVVAAVGWSRVAEAERSARREADTLAQVNAFQERILRGAYSHVKGRDVRLADVVDAAAADLRDEPFADPAVEIGYRLSLGISFLGLGMLDRAEQEFLRARARIAADGAARHDAAAIAIGNNLGLLYEDLGRLDAAEAELRDSLARRVVRYGAQHRETALARHNLASVLLKRGATEEALALATEAAGVLQRASGAASAEAISALTSKAMALAAAGRMDEADAAFAAAHAAAEQHLHPDHPGRLATASSRAAHLRRRGRLEEFVRVTESIVAARERVLGPAHPQTLVALNNLAVAHMDRAEYPAAEATLRRIQAAREAAGIVDGFEYIATGQNLTVSVRRQGRAVDAEALASALRGKAERSLPSGNWLRGVVLKEHGACLRELRRHAEAEPSLLQAHAILSAAVGSADARTQKVVDELVLLYEATGRPAEAAQWAARRPAGR